MHPAAQQNLPSFIVAPGQTDTLLVFAGVILVAAVLGIGVFFLWLHSLPERMVHKKWQYDIVAVLCLLALFTHMHALWVAALLLAFIKLPDFSVPDVLTPLRNIASSIDKIAEKEEVETRGLGLAANRPQAKVEKGRVTKQAEAEGDA